MSIKIHGTCFNHAVNTVNPVNVEDTEQQSKHLISSSTSFTWLTAFTMLTRYFFNNYNTTNFDRGNNIHFTQIYLKINSNPTPQQNIM